VSPALSPPILAVVLDLGGVLVDWNPRHLYRQVFAGDEEAMERFLSTICTPQWNLELDRGRPMREAVEELAERHPDHAASIRAYRQRWVEMVAGPLPGMPKLVADLRSAGLPTYVLTNSPGEAFPWACQAYPFLQSFDGALVSGDLGLVKPDPAIFRALISRFGLEPAATVFVDDVEANVASARACGLQALSFPGAGPLREALRSAGIAVPAPALG
jgi:2-haloacid dehalogenase